LNILGFFFVFFPTVQFVFACMAFWSAETKSVYQTSHFLVGFMGEFAGQLKSLANSGMLEKGPRTLNMSGEWTPVRTRSLSALSLYFAHHTLAALIQNIWRWLYLPRPGRSFSS
jgi:hypothetical protein